MKTTLLAASVAAILFSQPVFAHQAGDFIARAGSITVRPSESSDDVLGLGEFNGKRRWNHTVIGCMIYGKVMFQGRSPSQSISASGDFSAVNNASR